VSLLGTLEQLNLKHILQRLETHEKSGLLVVKQGERWVEFYFQQGRLLCIGPDRTNTSLEDRLVQAGVISPQARQDALQASDMAEPNETRMAMLLLEREYVSRDALRAWASKETTQILQQVLSWSTGEIYFEDEVKPPTGRLLVALSIATLLESISSPPSTPQPARPRITTVLVKDESASPSAISEPKASSAPPPVRASQLLPDPESIPTPRTTVSLFSPETSQPSNNTHPPVVASAINQGAPANNSTPLSTSQIVSPTVPRRIDTSFMKPEMVLMLTDLTSLRQRNPQIQLTPEQWQLFTLIDGHTSLQMVCQALAASPPLVCQVVGEMIALGLVYLLPPGAPAAKQPVTAGLSNGQQAPAAQQRPVFVPVRTTDPLPYPTSTPVQSGRGQRYDGRAPAAQATSFAAQGSPHQSTQPPSSRTVPVPQYSGSTSAKGYYSQQMPLTPSGRQVAVNGSYARAGRGR